MLQKVTSRAGVPDRDWDLSEQETVDIWSQRDAETDGGDALQPAGQHLEVLHSNLQDAGRVSTWFPFHLCPGGDPYLTLRASLSQYNMRILLTLI